MSAVCVGMVTTALNVVTPPVNANELTELFTKSSIPLSLKLKALDHRWQRLSLNQESLAPSFLFGISGLLESALRTNVYYTQGKIITISKQQYLVVYRPEGSNLNLSLFFQLGNKQAPASFIKELTPESKLVLSLINLSTINSLQDIQPFNLQKELEDAKKVLPPKSETPETLPPAPTNPS
jgi:hypothetical protein